MRLNRGAFAILLLLAAGCAAKGGPSGPLSVLPAKTETKWSGQIRFRKPHLMLTKRGYRLRPHTTATQNLYYHGGAIQPVPTIYLDFWGFTSDPDSEQTRITNFLNALGGSNWLNTVTQYWEWNGSYITNPANIVAGTWSDTANAVPSAPTTAQIAAETERVATHFGVSNYNVIYVIALPFGHNPAGYNTSFCAYHSDAITGTTVLPFVAFPYMIGSNCGVNFVNSGGAGTLDGVSIAMGHEIAETLTDLNGVSWNDSTTAEIADKCANIMLQNDSFGGSTLGTDEFPMQPLFSNQTSSCVHSSTATGADPFAQAVLAHTPYVYYRLDEGGGTAAVDGSAHNANATVGNPADVTRGATGLCCSPDTSYSFVTPGYLAISATLKHASMYTISAIIGGSYSTVSQCIVDYYGDCFGVDDGYLGWGNVGKATSKAIALTDNTNYFATASVDISHSPAVVTVSVDGGPQVPANISGVSHLATTTSRVDVGGPTCTTACTRVAKIDEIAIFPRPLTTAQIATLATTAGFTVPTPSPAPTGYAASVLALSPLAYYRLDDAANSAVADSSGNAYAGVVRNPSDVATGVTGICCSPDTAFSFAEHGFVALPSNMPTVTRATGYTIVAQIKGTYSALHQCVVDYQGNCFGIYHGSLGWALVGNAASQAVALTDGTPYFVAMTQQVSGGVNHVFVSVNGATLSAANPHSTAWPARAASYFNAGGGLCGTIPCAPVSTIDEVAIFNGVLTQAQITSLATAAGF
ncbi:MAG TPA: hypothetical protein VGG89_10025 [Candidatus Baltobacteraceae bacterium]|jgi:hypothetical protein